jgi:hypothetical protein
MSSHLQGKTVIYTRYSSEMQREESCEDQESDTRDGLTRKGIDHRNAVVLADKMISGEVADRAQLQKLCNMIDRGEVAKGITHSAENRDKANAVRRGQKGRAEKPDASVGNRS